MYLFIYCFGKNKKPFYFFLYCVAFIKTPNHRALGFFGFIRKLESAIGNFLEKIFQNFGCFTHHMLS